MTSPKFTNIFSNVLNSGYYSRPNRFEVDITFPPALQARINTSGSSGFDTNGFISSNPDGGFSGKGNLLDRLSLNAKVAALPGRALEVGQVNYSGGFDKKKPVRTTYSDLELQFYLSADLLEKQVFDMWQNYIFDPSYQISTYPDEYQGSVFVRKLDRDGKDTILWEYEYMNAWPSNVQDVIQDYESESTVDILPVTFTYNKWKFSKG